MRTVPALPCSLTSVLLLLAGCAKPPADQPIKAPLAKVKAGTTLTADPDPIVTDDQAGLGETTIRWTTKAAHTTLRVGGPSGVVFSGGGPKGAAKTGLWVNNGMTFYLQDADAPNPASQEATLGSLSVAVQ